MIIFNEEEMLEVVPMSVIEDIKAEIQQCVDTAKEHDIEVAEMMEKVFKIALAIIDKHTRV